MHTYFHDGDSGGDYDNNDDNNGGSIGGNDEDNGCRKYLCHYPKYTCT
jgi:hypothetical protein